jgi:hypothetical protein
VNQADIYASPGDASPAQDDRKARSRGRSLQGAAGVMYMLVKHVGITGEAYYQRTRTTVDAGAPTESSNSAELYGVQWGFAAFIF